MFPQIVSLIHIPANRPALSRGAEFQAPRTPLIIKNNDRRKLAYWLFRLRLNIHVTRWVTTSTQQTFPDIRALRHMQDTTRQFVHIRILGENKQEKTPQRLHIPSLSNSRVTNWIKKEYMQNHQEVNGWTCSVKMCAAEGLWLFRI